MLLHSGLGAKEYWYECAFLSSVCALDDVEGFLKKVDSHGISQARPGYLFNHLSTLLALSTRVT